MGDSSCLPFPSHDRMTVLITGISWLSLLSKFPSSLHPGEMQAYFGCTELVHHSQIRAIEPGEAPNAVKSLPRTQRLSIQRN